MSAGRAELLLHRGAYSALAVVAAHLIAVLPQAQWPWMGLMLIFVALLFGFGAYLIAAEGVR